ncbi:MAG: NADP-dependent oxidoreductase [Bacteroidetes bacterium]|nr:MAG: NADP-dependent oxidoreductase [Bacteroidota bacterium]
MNTQVKLAKRPVGVPDPSTWSIEKSPIPEPADGQFLVKIEYISLDPAMRGWLNDARSYIRPVQIGEVMRAGAVGQVIASKNPDFKVGDYVHGQGGVQQYAVTDGAGWHKVDPTLAPLPVYLGTLGLAGFTAYFGLLEHGQPKPGETVLVSGAAGAVGSIVGQIAKLKGCRAVGIAGGPEKCRYIVEELGFDGAIDYKNEDVRVGIKTHCPQGVDVYFDNVGGDILDIALTRINMHARIVICGAISQYNNTTPPKGPSNYLSLLVNRARMEGFVVFDHAKDYGKAAREMGQWLKEGKLKTREHIFEGIENFHETFLRLFTGEKLGKLALKVSE